MIYSMLARTLFVYYLQMIQICFFADKDFDTLIRRTNTTLQLITEWFYANKLSLNVEKTSFMIYYNKRKRYMQDNFKIEINDMKISQVPKIKFLGVWMDEQLNWKSHITYISGKIGKVIGILKKIRHSVGKKILLNLLIRMNLGAC